MLISTSQLKRFITKAIDGKVGRVDDFYFPRGEWIIRYLLFKAFFESIS